jgi:chromosome segregation ATPase
MLLALLVSGAAAAQEAAASAEQQAEKMRAQLREVVDKEAQLQERVRQLEEELKPENIQFSIAGTGTTDAAALRAQRRAQLERQKANADEQLRSLAESRLRLEAAITNAEAEAVQLRANANAVNNAPPPNTSAQPIVNAVPASPTMQTKQTPRRKAMRARRNRTRRRAPSN